MECDQKLQCNLESAQVEDKYLQDRLCPGNLSGRSTRKPQFKRRNAKRPWS